MGETHDGGESEMDRTETTTGQPAEYPATAEDLTAALNAAWKRATGRDNGHPGGNDPRHRMRRVAQETGLGRESLYKSMRAGASPEFATVLRVLRSLGFRLQAHPAAAPDQDKP